MEPVIERATQGSTFWAWKVRASPNSHARSNSSTNDDAKTLDNTPPGAGRRAGGHRHGVIGEYGMLLYAIHLLTGPSSPWNVNSNSNRMRTFDLAAKPRCESAIRTTTTFNRTPDAIHNDNEDDYNDPTRAAGARRATIDALSADRHCPPATTAPRQLRASTTWGKREMGRG